MSSRLLALALVGAGSLAAAEVRAAEELDELRAMIEVLQARDADRQRQIDDLQTELRRQRSGDTSPADGGSALDRALEELPDDGAPTGSTRAGATGLRLIDISADVLSSAGSSTVRDSELSSLQAGSHDPRQRGFNLSAIELQLKGAVDPYFIGEIDLVYFLDSAGESRFEVEEAFATSQFLPHGLQAEFGTFFTEFGRANPTHTHAWDWIDQPVILSRYFGEDGVRGPGVRLGWLLPFDFYSELHYGMQDAEGETMVSFLASAEVFEERPVGGRPFVARDTQSLGDMVHLARWVGGFDVTDTTSAQVGFSGLYGPNATGPDGDTWIYGADAVVKWRPEASRRGYPFVIFTTEVMRRDYGADDFFGPLEEGGPDEFLPSTTLHDWGLYAQALWGIRQPWAAGMRVEYANSRGSTLTGTELDPFRDKRVRLSPLVQYAFSEFSRVRVQYNHDQTDFLRHDNAHTVWMNLEFSFGQHPAHRY